MKCIIVEDQVPAQRILQKYVQDFGSLQLEGVFTNALQALEYLQNHSVDIVFLDVHLPKLSGIDFIKALDQKPAIILTTAFQDYALQGYELDVVDYLLKPFSFERFVKAVMKVSIKKNDETKSSETDALFIKSGHEFIRINPSKIFYIKTDLDYTEIVLSDQKLLSSETLAHWEHQLKPLQFERAHRSFLVNKKAIEKVSGNQATLSNGSVIPIGRAYKESLMASLIQ